MSDETAVTVQTAIARLVDSTARTDAVLREATLDVFGSLGFAPLRDLQFQVTDDDFPALATQPPWFVQRTKRGETIPVYQTEAELRFIRDRSRVMSFYNEFALCGIENRVNYILGDNGLKYTAQPLDRHDPGSRKLAAELQEFITVFGEVNDLPEFEAETQVRLDTDGEAIVRLFPDSDGLARLRFVEPEHLRAPGGDQWPPELSFGVETEPLDVETVKGYWIVEAPLRSWEPDFVDESEVVHFKANTPRSSKRGLPVYFPVERNLRRCEDLLGSMTSMAKARAKIALIRKMTGTTSDQAKELLAALTAVKVTDPSTGEELNVERLRNATVLTAGANTTYEFPPVGAGVGAADFVEVLQAELRAVAARLQMSEWMFTALADAKYSNAFVVEAPTLKSFKRLQRRLTRGFGENRFGSRKSVMWRAVKLAVEAGLLPREVLTACRIQCEGPTLESRDKSAEAATNKTYSEMGVKSLQTIQTEQGLDPETEAANFAEARDRKLVERMPDLAKLVLQVQEDFYAGKLPRPAAAALLVKLEMSRDDAEALLPLAGGVSRVAQPAPEPGQPGDETPGDRPGDGPPGEPAKLGGDGPTPDADPTGVVREAVRPVETSARPARERGRVRAGRRRQEARREAGRRATGRRDARRGAGRRAPRGPADAEGDLPGRAVLRTRAAPARPQGGQERGRTRRRDRRLQPARLRTRGRGDGARRVGRAREVRGRGRVPAVPRRPRAGAAVAEEPAAGADRPGYEAGVSCDTATGRPRGAGVSLPAGRGAARAGREGARRVRRVLRGQDAAHGRARRGEDVAQGDPPQGALDRPLRRGISHGRDRRPARPEAQRTPAVRGAGRAGEDGPHRAHEARREPAAGVRVRARGAGGVSVYIVYLDAAGNTTEGDSVASNGGWAGWCEWAAGLQHPEYASLAEDGWSDAPQVLAAELSDIVGGRAVSDRGYIPRDVLSVTDTLLSALRDAPPDTAAVMISDGIEGDGEDDEPLTESFDESKHPRGRPENAGEFTAVSVGRGASGRLELGDLGAVAETHAGGSKVFSGDAAESFARSAGLDAKTPEAVRAVAAFQGSGTLNAYNRDPAPFGRRPDLDATNAVIDKAISDAPPLPESVSVFRGVDDAPAMSALKPGAEFTDRAHLSTSIDRDYMQGFHGVDKPDNVVLQIRLPAGTRALYAGVHPAYAHERELILPRNSRYRVVSVAPMGRGVYVVADYVPPRRRAEARRAAPRVDRPQPEAEEVVPLPHPAHPAAGGRVARRGPRPGAGDRRRAVGGRAARQRDEVARRFGCAASRVVRRVEAPARATGERGGVRVEGRCRLVRPETRRPRQADGTGRRRSGDRDRGRRRARPWRQVVRPHGGHQGTGRRQRRDVRRRRAGRPVPV
jgi:hypothetical protein